MRRIGPCISSIPVEDWSYYEDRGLEVTDGMRENATVLQEDLVEINAELEHPEAWVRSTT